jgi:predicted Zn-dependent protease
MIGVVAYAVTTRPPAPSGSLDVHLPGINQLIGQDQSCPERIYPPGAQYRFQRCRGETPVGWPACSTVTYSVDPSGAPSGYQADVVRAVAEVAQATGLRLVPVGAHPNVSISWDPSLYDPQPGTSGEAGVTSFRSAGSHATSAGVKVSSHLMAGSQVGVGEEPILLHELGHAVGLAHFSGAVVMNPLDHGYATFQPGDRAGLDRLYHPSTCG